MPADHADWLAAAAALDCVMDDARVLGTEKRSLLDSRGCVLAADLHSPIDLPPWDSSAMDGFAVRGADVASACAGNGVALRIVDDIAAGAQPAGPIGPGTAARIMTGAPVPPGCDSVIRVEHTDGGREGGTVLVLDDADAGRNIRRRGEELRTGDRVLAVGVVLDPPRIAAAAAVGAARIAVHRRPRVGILASGDELVSLDGWEEARAGRRIVSSNSYGLASHLAELGMEACILGIAGDTRDSLREHVQRAAGCDALITTAGVSVGDHDHVRPVMRELDTQLRFWRVRARPGSALAYGRVGALGGIPWWGLPGNPASTLVCFEWFVRPALLRMAGHAAVFRAGRTATLDEAYPATGNFTHFARVVARPGTARVGLAASQSSGAVTSMAGADGLVLIPPGPARPPGSTVTLVSFADGLAPTPAHPAA